MRAKSWTYSGTGMERAEGLLETEREAFPPRLGGVLQECSI